jgi:hypothetical protein
MDPVALIVTALTEGTALELRGTSATAVQDAYASLWARVRKRLAGLPDGATVLARHAEAPQTWEAPLSAALAAAGAAHDDDLIAAATALLRLADEPGFRSGKYAIGPPDPTAIPVIEQGVPGRPGAGRADNGIQHNSLNGHSGY